VVLVCWGYRGNNYTSSRNVSSN